MKKKILFFIVIIFVIIISIVGYRYIRYQDFIGKFYSESGRYYKFNLFGWMKSEDDSEEIKCTIWNCNISKGNIYYIKNNILYLRIDSKKVITMNYSLEKKDNKIFLYIYNGNGVLFETYVKEH